MPKTKRKPTAKKPTPSTMTFPWMGLVLLVVGSLAYPLVITRLNAGLELAFLAPLALYGLAWLLAAYWSRRSLFAGDRGFVALTLLLLGLGVVEQLRFGTWESSWTAWRAYLPLLVGLGGFFFCLRGFSVSILTAFLAKGKWFFWLGALATMGVLLCFGRPYRGGLFLPGNINPTELVKLLLVCFAAAWLPTYKEPLSRTFMGVPIPPIGVALWLGIVWGVPLLGAVAVRDLGLALILCLTLVFMLMVLSGKLGWLLLGVGFAALAGVVVQLASAHSGERFRAWLNPFDDPLDSGWQIGQSLSAEYAGGLWGTGIGAGQPELVPIVSSDFVYAALAEEWGLIACGLLLVLYWCWLARAIAVSVNAKELPLRLLGSGFAAVLGAQILLNVGGVTKALPMTGITLPFISQGGFSLLVVLLFCGLVAILSKEQPRPSGSRTARRGKPTSKR